MNVLRTLLTFLLVPVVLIAGPGRAAAETFSNPVEATVYMSVDGDGAGQLLGAKIDCTFKAYYSRDESAGGLLAIKGTYRCFGTYLTGWASYISDIDEANLTVKFKGSNESGTCVGESYNSGLSESQLKAGQLEPTVGLAATCDVTQVCATVLTIDRQFGEEHRQTVSACSPMAMGSSGGDESKGECTYGTVQTPQIESVDKFRSHELDVTDYPRYGWFRTVRFRVESTQAWDWYSYVVVKDDSGTRTTVPTGTNWPSFVPSAFPKQRTVQSGPFNPIMPLRVVDDFGRTSQWTEAGNFIPGAGEKVVSSQLGALKSWAGTPLKPPDETPKDGFTVIGAGVFAVYKNTQGVPVAGQAQFPLIDMGVWTPGEEKSKFGVNVPGMCSFYWGERIYNFPDQTWDDPQGESLNQVAPGWSETPPDGSMPGDDEPEESCNFQLTDPSSWLSGGMCAVAGLLGQVLKVLGDVLKALVNLPLEMLEMLVELFVPKNSDAWGLDELMDQLHTKPPFNLALEAGDQVQQFAAAFSSAGGCGVLGNFKAGPHDAQLNCSQIASAPGMSAFYGLVQVGLVGITVIGCWRMILGYAQR